MTRAGRSAPVRLTALCIIGACLLSSSTALPAESARTLALADFAVQAPQSAAVESAWLGPALSELVQAKMQLFGGARVLERQRVSALLREAQSGVGAAGEDPAALAAFIPADVLIAGSVIPDPQDPHRVRVQARAFEVETSKIVSETAFSGTGDLAGLLKIAGDLARTLAAGLKLSFTPEQLAYAEPTTIDTLRLFVAGEGHLAAGRHRAAIAAFQQALEGNEGRYYAAAHRLQGEAYQALARSSTAQQDVAVREEYLKKFKEDALAASGAIYDLGLAYEANQMWNEAVGAFRDYLLVAGVQADPVAWRLTQNAESLLEGERFLHSVVRGRAPVELSWVVVDAQTGKEVRRHPLAGLIKTDRASGPVHAWEIKGFAGGATIFRCAEGADPNRRNPALDHVVALEETGRVRWEWRMNLPRAKLWHVEARGGRVYVSLYQQRGETPERDSILTESPDGYVPVLLTFDARDGRLLSRVVPRTWEVGYPSGLDPVAGTLSAPEGTYDLDSGSLRPATLQARLEIVDQRKRLMFVRPTGVRGIGYIQEPSGLRLYREGRELKSLDCTLDLEAVWNTERSLNPEGEGPIICRTARGWLGYDPQSGTEFSIYTDLQWRDLPTPAARSAQHLAFTFLQDPAAEAPDQRYGLPATEKSLVLNLFNARDGSLEGRYRLPVRGRHDPTFERVFIAGGDVIIAYPGMVERVNLAAKTSGPLVASTGGTRVRLARCLLAAGDLAGAQEALDQSREELADDAAALLIRTRIALGRGEPGEASRQALRALGAGGLDDADARECLEAVRAEQPLVRGMIRLPVRGRVDFEAVCAPGVVVCRLRSRGDRELHVVFDVATGASKVWEVPDMHWGRDSHPYGLKYSTTLMFAAKASLDRWGGAEQLVRVDPARGTQIRSGSVFEKILYVPLSMDAGACVREMKAGRRTHTLASFDPKTMEVLKQVDLGDAGCFPRWEDDGVAVFAGDPERNMFNESVENGEVPLVVVDTGAVEKLLAAAIPLRSERVAAAASDREAVYVVRSGADYETFRAGGRGVWFSVEALALTDGRSLWRYESEGIFAGNLLLEGDTITFPAHEGKLPYQPASEWHYVENKLPFWPDKMRAGEHGTLERGRFPLMKIALARRTGKKTGEEPVREMNRAWALPEMNPPRHRWRGVIDVFDADTLSSPYVAGAGSPAGPRIAFPGTAETIVDPEHRKFFVGDPSGWWLHSPAQHPVPVVRQDPEQGWHVVLRGNHYEKWTTLVNGELAYESIGGGVVLVKDFAGGRGLVELFAPRRAKATVSR